MDTKDYSTEHCKGQHLFSEERHEIEVRLKDGWSIYHIAKHLGRPYNTIKNEVARGSVKLYRGKVVRYKAVSYTHLTLPTPVQAIGGISVSSLCRDTVCQRVVFGCLCRGGLGKWTLPTRTDGMHKNPI